MQQNEWIYDWNVATPPAIAPGTHVLLNDETLREKRGDESSDELFFAPEIRIGKVLVALPKDGFAHAGDR